MTNIAEALFRDRAAATTPASLAEQLSRLVWRGADNGASVHKELEGWIERGDQERAAVALAYGESLLFGTSEQMSAALDRLTVRLPELVPNIEARRAWLRENF